MDSIGIDVLTEGIGGFISHVLSKFYDKNSKINNREKVAKAVSSIQKAVIRTRLHIQEFGYKSNDELPELWWNAFNDSVAANLDYEIPEYLYNKARFWGDTSIWTIEPSSMMLVPKLARIEDDCLTILESFKKN